MFWSARGGAGTSVVAAGTALAARRPATIIDLAGDQPAVLGVDESAGQGITDWLASNAPLDALDRLATPIGPQLRLVHRGAAAPAANAATRWNALAAAVASLSHLVVVDAGAHPPAALCPEFGSPPRDGMVDIAVTRLGFLELRSLAALDTPPSGLVVVNDELHAHTPADASAVTGAPVLAVVASDPKIARAVDAGVLTARPPRALTQPLERLVNDLERPNEPVGGALLPVGATR